MREDQEEIRKLAVWRDSEFALGLLEGVEFELSGDFPTFFGYRDFFLRKSNPPPNHRNSTA
jgi:hypothetical protein